jgi:hypothetical protein
LVIGPRLEGNSFILFTIQTPPPPVTFSSPSIPVFHTGAGFCRNSSTRRRISPKQVPGHNGFGQVERDVAPVTDHLRADLDELVAQRN